MISSKGTVITVKKNQRWDEPTEQQIHPCLLNSLPVVPGVTPKNLRPRWEKLSRSQVRFEAKKKAGGSSCGNSSSCVEMQTQTEHSPGRARGSHRNAGCGARRIKNHTELRPAMNFQGNIKEFWNDFEWEGTFNVISFHHTFC